MRYKLAALDLDGTLLNSNGKLPIKHVQAVKKAQDAGIIVVIATGRYPMQTKWIVDQLGFNGILITHDGAAIIKSSTWELIHEYSYSINEISPLIAYCRKNNIDFSMCTAFDYFTESLQAFQENDYTKFDITPSFQNDVLQIKDRIMKLTINDKKKVGGWQEMDLPSNIRKRVDLEFFKEYIPFDAYKTNGLKKVLNMYGINPSEIIAIGDYYNDIDMLQFAGVGIAMDNAPDDVKEIADDVTNSNDQDGVFHAFEKYLFYV